MEQRRLRLGDILDDYCPRERRVTNHAVVAMIEENVKQTRCTTCEAEHAYKGARVPRRRKQETPGALYKEVLAGMPDADGDPLAAAAAAAEPAARPVPAVLPPPADLLPPAAAAVDSALPLEDLHPAMHNEDDAPPGDEFADAPMPDDGAPAIEWPVHRRLIRATLPRVEGQKDARPVPEFTIRQAPPPRAAGGFRGERMKMRGGSGNGNGHGPSNGNRGNAGGARFQGRPGDRGAAPSRFRSGGGGNGSHAGKRGRGPR